MKKVQKVRITVSSIEPSFQVRGLTMKEVAECLAPFAEDLAPLMEIVGQSGAEAPAFDEKFTGFIIGRLLRNLPALSAKAIAIAADEPDEIAAAGDLPLGTAVAALDAIARLTLAAGHDASVRDIIAQIGAATQAAAKNLPKGHH